MWLAAVSALAGILVAGPAAAQEWTPRTMGNRLGADIDFLPTHDAKLFDVSFVGQVRLTRHVHLDFDFPWGYAGPDAGNGSFVLGNPTLGAHYATRLGAHAEFFVGGAITVPTHFRDSLGTARAGDLTYIRVYDDFYRFLPEYVDVMARVGVELAFRPLFMRFDLRPVALVPVGNDVPNNRAELIVLSGNEFELLARMGLGGGLRLQGVFFPTDRALFQNDRAQLAFEPFFAYEPEPHGFFVRLGLLIAADPPLGFGFDRDKIATVRASMGGKW
jgi:hypothetical protein